MKLIKTDQLCGKCADKHGLFIPSYTPVGFFAGKCQCCETEGMMPLCEDYNQKEEE